MTYIIDLCSTLRAIEQVGIEGHEAEVSESADCLEALHEALAYWKERALRVEIERDQFALEAKYNARDAARYRFVRSKWQFSDAEVDRRVDADMAEDKAEDESDAEAWGIEAANRSG